MISQEHFLSSTIKAFFVDSNWPDLLCNRLTQAHESGQRLHIIIVSEGAVDKSGNHITCEQIRKVKSMIQFVSFEPKFRRHLD